MLISAAYVSKIWTTHERRSALARAVEQREEYILPIRLDETEVPGFPASRSYLRWPPESAQSIAAIIKSKLRLFQNEQNAQRRPVDGANSRGVGRISRASLEAIPQ